MGTLSIPKRTLLATNVWFWKLLTREELGQPNADKDYKEGERVVRQMLTITDKVG